MVKELTCSTGEIVLVDDEDYPILSRHSWRTQKDGKGPGAYTRMKDARGSAWRHVCLHHLVLGSFSPTTFLNGNSLDCRKANLVSATSAQISIAYPKRKGRCSSKYKGVTFDKALGKYRAQIMKDKKRIDLGAHVLEDDAGRAYNAKAVELFGEHAWLNPVPPANGATVGEPDV